MKRIIIFSALTLNIILYSCSGRDLSNLSADTEDTEISPDAGVITQELEFVVEKEVPKIEIFNKDNRKLLFSIDYGAGGGFFVQKDRTEREFLNKIDSIGTENGSTVIEISSANGRKGRLTIKNEGSALKILFGLEKKLSSEQPGVILNTTSDEGYYGLMERVVQGDQDKSWEEGMKEGLNLRGQEVLLYTYPTLSIYSPFFVSTAKYGIFVESNWPGRYLFGTEREDRTAIIYEGATLPLTVFTGENLLRITEKYSGYVGTSLMPPKFVFGHLRWRDDHYNLPYFFDKTPYDGPYNSMVVEDIVMMQKLNIPCSAYWIDRPWGEGDFGYDNLEYDEKRLPNPVAMIKWLESYGIKFMLWISPWAAGDKMVKEGESKGYFVTNPTPAPPPEAKLIDLTNPGAADWWQSYLIKRIKDGVIGFKLDRGEEKVPDGILFSGKYYNGKSYREYHNYFPYLYAKSVREAFDKAGVKDFIVMPRAGWVGTAKNAVVWGGDTAPTEYGLRSAIIAAQRAALMNFPIWGSDTCGYDTQYRRQSDREVCMRWIQFSAFTPIMEVGPTLNAAFWSRVPDGQSGVVDENGYPYDPFYDEELLAVYIMYTNLHTDLIEYSYRQAEKAHKKGTPVIRPMIALYPDNKDFLDEFEQYFYGDDILVAPVWKKGTQEKQVFIPEGEWMDVFTGKEYKGPVRIRVETPYYKIPVFIRKGSEINLGDMNLRFENSLITAKSRPGMSDWKNYIR